VSDKVLPCTGRVDDGCIADLVHGGCDLAAAAAIVVNLGRVVANAAAELTVGGKGGGSRTTGGGEEASKDGSALLLSSTLKANATAVELKARGGRVKDGRLRCQMATQLLLPGGEGGRECSHQLVN
jgi:hypothetical protein